MKRTVCLAATALVACGGATALTEAEPGQGQPAHDHAAHDDVEHVHEHDGDAEHNGHVHEHGEHGEHGTTDVDHHRMHGGMQHDFSDVERWVGVFENPARDTWQRPDHLVELLEIEPGMTVADIGAGTGYLLPPLVAAVGTEGRVLALDIEASLVDHMNSRIAEHRWSSAEASVIATDDPGIEPESVDRVVILNTWHHISDRETYVARIASGLAPAGALYIVDFTLETERGPGVDHRLAPETVVAELEAGGLDASIVTDEELPDQYVVVGRRTE